MRRLDRHVIPYYIGAVLDAFAAIVLVSPAGSPLRAIANPGVDPAQVDFADGTRMAFGLMLGWTLLLMWGARRPIERRVVLMLTAFPVVTGMMFAQVLDIAGGHANASGSAPTLLLEAVLVATFTASYVLLGRGDQAARTRDIPQPATS